METKSPESEVDRLLKELKGSIPSRFHGKITEIRHQISRISTGVYALQDWKHAPAAAPEWHGYGMTLMEERLIESLRAAGPSGLSKERLLALQYANQLDDWPDMKILDIRICYIRQKLEAHKAPWWIETVHGRGWILHEGEGKPRIGSKGATIWSQENIRPTRKRIET
jgi:hypothetical protein